jgi:hypothetical protein
VRKTLPLRLPTHASGVASILFRQVCHIGDVSTKSGDLGFWFVRAYGGRMDQSSGSLKKQLHDALVAGFRSTRALSRFLSFHLEVSLSAGKISIDESNTRADRFTRYCTSGTDGLLSWP